MINALIEFFAVNFAWVFGLALYNTPEGTPHWINFLLLMVIIVFVAAAIGAMWDDF